MDKLPIFNLTTVTDTRNVTLIGYSDGTLSITGTYEGHPVSESDAVLICAQHGIDLHM